MFIVDDMVKGMVDLASEVVETVTGGLVDPSEIIEGFLRSPVGDLVALTSRLALGNPQAFSRLAEELAEILER